MKITTAQRNLALTGGATEKRVEAIATELRSGGIIPKGGRGPYAPEATAEEIAMFTLAVAGANRIADASETACMLAELEDMTGATLLSAIVEAISDPAVAGRLKHIRLMTNHPMAEITYSSGPVSYRLFLRPELWHDDFTSPDAAGQAFVGPIGHIGGGALQQIALEFAAPVQGGWAEASEG